MPKKAKKPCSYPGCPELVDKGYCEKHRKDSQESPTKISKSQPKSSEDLRIHRLYGRAWQKRRAVQLASHPWCEDCLNVGIYSGATDVHHVIKHGGDPILFNSSPLISLCHGCHSRRTLGEMRGEREDYYPHILFPFDLPVYLVCGAPASGKSTFVDQHKAPGDVVSDLDQIIANLTGHPLYYPEHQETVREGIRVRNRQLESLANRPDDGHAIWMIVGAPDPRDRMVWRNLLKPRIIYMLLCPLEVCIQRIDSDPRRKEVRDHYKQAAAQWFEKYQPLAGETIIQAGGAN